ncbi:MAG: hypothetical protein AABZ06_07165 [Bdellovibrionota bacterium]
MRSRIYIVILLGIVLAASWSCGKDDESTTGSAVSLNLASTAQKALPLNSSISSSLMNSLRIGANSIGAMGYTGLTWDSTITTNDSQMVVGSSGPFRMECHDGMTAAEDTVNNCPEGTTRDMNNKYSATTLIGLIYSADKYFASNVFSKATTACTMTGASELTNHSPTYTGSTQFIYSIPDFDCLFVEDTTSCSWCKSSHYYLYKKTTGTKANEIYSLLGTYFQERNETFKSTNSQIQQLYLRNGSDEKPALMAFALAAAAPYDTSGGWYSRTLIVLNITDNRFFIKFGSGVVALGKGGYDAATGSIIGGNFVVKLYNSGTTHYYCLTQSSTGAISLSADGSACDSDTTLKDYFKKFFAADSGFWSKTGTDTAKAFFGLTDDEIDAELASIGVDVNRVLYTTIPTAGDATQFLSAIAK